MHPFRAMYDVLHHIRERTFKSVWHHPIFLMKRLKLRASEGLVSVCVTIAVDAKLGFSSRTPHPISVTGPR